MMTARTIAILDLLHHGYHPPPPGHPDHDRLMAEWTQRYRVRLACAERMIEAVAVSEAGDTPCHGNTPMSCHDWNPHAIREIPCTHPDGRNVKHAEP